MKEFDTEIHSENPDLVSDEPVQSNQNFNNDTETLYTIKTIYRFLRKKLFARIRKVRNKNKSFKTILFITNSVPPSDFVSAFGKQYPDKKFKILIPLDSTKGFVKQKHKINYFFQNRINHARLYKQKVNRENVEVCGLYSKTFSGKNRTKLQFLAPYIKASRILAKKLKPDIIHADNVPFFLGVELEKKRYFPIKVIQTVRDFSEFEDDKTDPYWAAVNLADKNSLKKLCRDKIIRKNLFELFNIHNKGRFYQVRKCLDFLYSNYYKFRKQINHGSENSENTLFNKLNQRTLELFPQMAYEDDLYYNTMFYTIKRVDFWSVISETYYNELLSKPELSGKMYERLCGRKNKSGYFSYGCCFEEKDIYQNFNWENFRELRPFNKKYLIKEFSQDRIKTKFVDKTLFKNDEYVVKGWLDSFYDAPLIFCAFSSNFLQEGADIALTVILKLFEEYRNIQVIISIPDGLKNKNMKSWISFLEDNSSFDGRWVFINQKVNLEQFFASSDITLLTARKNPVSKKHYYALKYGCIPVSLKLGIYNDTITDIMDDMTLGCGFKVKQEAENGENIFENLHSTVLKAINLYTQNPSSWNLLVKNAIKYNSGWTFGMIEKYNEIYNEL